MSKHTPGPWRVARDRNSVGDTVWAGNLPVAICSPVRVFLASGQTFQITGDEASANARLIEAAPELLGALHIQHACGAPAKANLYDEEGVEGWHWTHPDGREWTAAGAWDEAPPMHPVVRAAIAKATGEQA